MGFPENEWHGHDLTTLIDGCAKRLWGRIKGVHPWDDITMVDKTRAKEAVLPNVLDVLDVIHENRLEHLTEPETRLLDGLEYILSNYELHMGDKAELQPQPVRSTLSQISALVADARNGFQEV